MTAQQRHLAGFSFTRPAGRDAEEQKKRMNDECQTMATLPKDERGSVHVCTCGRERVLVHLCLCACV